MQVIKSFIKLLLLTIFLYNLLPLLNTQLQLICKQTYEMISLIITSRTTQALLYLVNALLKHSVLVSVYRQIDCRSININVAVGCHFFPPGPQLPSQPHSIITFGPNQFNCLVTVVHVHEKLTQSRHIKVERPRVKPTTS